MSSSEELSHTADELSERLRNAPSRAVIDEAEGLLDRLRDSRKFDRLLNLAELVSRYRPEDLRVREWPESRP